MAPKPEAFSREERERVKTIIARLFPKLGSFKVVKQASMDYNCVAWAAGDDSTHWGIDEGVFWPPQAIREASLPAFQAAFRTLGYEPCGQNDLLEAGFEKVALFVCGVVPSHAARQLAHGWWTSKLGDNWVIEHESPRGLEGALYGRVAVVMKRPLAK
jgi:hypothetical protein